MVVFCDATHGAGLAARWRVVQRGRLRTGPRGANHPTDEQDPFIYHLIERIAHIAERGDVLARLLRYTQAQGLSLHIRDHYGQLPSTPPRARFLDSDEQRRLIEFLHDSLDTDIDIPTLAGLVGMTVHGFRRAFIRSFGFATPSHFTTMFKQRVGVTPTVYRRNT